MKVLSVQQPWASLIAECGKDIENRNWSTNYRGPVAIHAASTQSADRFPIPAGVTKPKRQKFGGIIAVAVLADVVRASDSPWFSGPYGLVLRNVVPVKYVAMRGYPRLFDLPEGVKLCPLS